MNDKYYYYKTINNNAIVALNKQRHEIILFGKAIGIKCNRSLYSTVDPELIERVFIQKGNPSYLEQLIAEIPYEYFNLVEQVISLASQRLDYNFKDSIYLTLLDHIYFAHKMIVEGESICNPLLAEIKLFNRKEFDVSLEIIDCINEKLNSNFDQNEAAYLAFHFINSMSHLNSNQNKKIILMLDKTLQYISTFKGVNLDETSYYYGRLISHIKYFFIRKMANESVEEKEVMNKVMLDSIKEIHHYEWQLAEKIRNFCVKEFGFEISEQEVAYLTMHIVPMIVKEERK